MCAEKYKQPFFEVLESELRFRIFSLLNIYPELSFSEISRLLNKNKSTLHPHLQKLIEIGVIKVSREEKVRGNFTRNYYSIKSDVFKEMGILDEESIDKSIFTVLKNWMKFIIKISRLYEKYFNGLELEENGIKVLKEILYNQEALSGMYFFSVEQYKRVNRLTMDYLQKLEKIQSEIVKEEKPYYVLSLTIPIKQIIEKKARK
jgi:DNA-binding transcriptional ArsR family regulator